MLMASLETSQLFDTCTSLARSILNEPKKIAMNVTQQDDESVECFAQDFQIVSSIRNSKRVYDSQKNPLDNSSAFVGYI